MRTEFAIRIIRVRKQYDPHRQLEVPTTYLYGGEMVTYVARAEF